MKIPRSFQDYDEDDEKLNRRVRRWDFWEALIKLKHEYSSHIPKKKFDSTNFLSWLEDTYGIRVVVEKASQGITDDYEIIDEQKYLIFLLKFSGDA